MSAVRRSLALILMAALSACASATASPSVSSQPTDSPTPEASPSVDIGSPDATPGAEPSAEPTDGDAGDTFTCDLPLVDAGSAPLANIVDVRVGTHDGYDRLVFEFEQGTPELTLAGAGPPFSQDASGLPLDIDGESFLGIVMRGGSKQTDAGTSSYDGPSEFDTGFPMLVAVVEGGDFERQSTWYLGLAQESCVRLSILDDPPRVVIDVER